MKILLTIDFCSVRKWNKGLLRYIQRYIQYIIYTFKAADIIGMRFNERIEYTKLRKLKVCLLCALVMSVFFVFVFDFT